MRTAKTFFVNCIEPGYDLLKFLLENNIKIDYIISLNNEQAKKFKISSYKDFSDLSKKYGVPIYYPEKFNLLGNNDLDFFRKEKPDLLMVFGWQRLIPKEVLGVLSIGALGAHGSSEALPKGRGKATVNWSIIENKKRFLTHLYYIDEGADSGDIIDCEECDINEFDTCNTVHQKVQLCIRKLMLRNLQLIIEGKANRTKQEGEPTYYSKRTAEDGKIDWSKTTLEVYNLVRAVTKPYPGAFAFLGEEKIVIWRCQPFDTKLRYDEKLNGEIVEVFFNSEFVVKTKDSSILVVDYEIKDGAKIKEGKVLR